MRRLAILVALVSACYPSPGAFPTAAPPTATPVSSPSPSSATPTPEPRPAHIAAIQRLDARVGFVSGTDASLGLVKTSDGGATWRRIAIPAAGVAQVRFIDERTAWAVGIAPDTCLSATAPACRSVVLRTTDGGGSWQQTRSWPYRGGSLPYDTLEAIDADHAIVVTRDLSCQALCPSDLNATNDGGQTWRIVKSDTFGPIRFASARRGWIVTYGSAGVNYGSQGSNVLLTTDGGNTWQAALRGQPVLFVDAASDTVAWALARDGGYCTSSNCSKYELFRSTDGGGSWSSLGNPKDQATCSRGHLLAPVFANATRGWMPVNLGAGGAEGGTGGILTTNDAGKTWTCASTPANARLVSAADPDHVWATSDVAAGTSLLYSSDDGGVTWRALAVDATR